MPITIRLADPARDAAAVADVYRPYVEQTPISFELEPPSADEMLRRFRARNPAHPFLVAQDGDGVVGFAPTWPVPCPVLSLDHVWASRSLAVRTCEQGWSLRSDHRPVLFTFE